MSYADYDNDGDEYDDAIEQLDDEQFYQHTVNKDYAALPLSTDVFVVTEATQTVCEGCGRPKCVCKKHAKVDAVILALREELRVVRRELDTSREENKSLRKELRERKRLRSEESPISSDESLHSSVERMDHQTEPMDPPTEPIDGKECKTCKELRPLVSFGSGQNKRNECSSCKGKRARANKKAKTTK